MTIFFDTETTGLPDKGQYDNPLHPSAPHIVELAWLRADKNGEVIDADRYLITPNGFEIPARASAVHGITTEKALNEGRPLLEVITAFRDACLECKTIVAHNLAYDLLCIRAEFYRLFGKHPNFTRFNLECTKELMTPICKLPAKWGTGYKWPSLQEAYMHLFNEPVRGAHGALCDTEHCYRIYFKQKYGRDVPLPSKAA